MHWLAYEGLADAGLRRKLRSSRGFCPTHTRLLYTVVVEQTRNLSAIAQIMRELSAADLKGRSASPGPAAARPAARKPLAGWGARSAGW